jgi:hypothetical protein
MSTTCRVFPEVFKREAVDGVMRSGLSIGKVARANFLIAPPFFSPGQHRSNEGVAEIF